MEYLFSSPFQTSFALDQILLYITLSVLTFICYKMMIAQKLIDSVILMSMFSLLIGLCYLFLDAPDVTMTEVALGSALSTCVILNVIKITGDQCIAPSNTKLVLATFLCLVFAIILSFICLYLPEFGLDNTNLQLNTTKYYIENTHNEINIPSLVAAILASYRGFDTLGETTVVLIAGLSVLIIRSRKKSS